MVSLPPLPENGEKTKSPSTDQGDRKAAPPKSNNANRPEAPAAAPSFFGENNDLVLLAASVLILAGAGIAWFLRRRRHSNHGVTLPKHMHVAAALPLRFHCSAYLVEIGGRPLLVGVDPAGIKSIVPLSAAGASSAHAPFENTDPSSNLVSAGVQA